MQDRNIVILGSGFAGVGKSTHLKRLFVALKKKSHLNCIYLDKDVIATTLLGKEPYFTDYYDKYVHHQSYQLMISLTLDHLKISKTNNVIILDGIFGDKINEYVKDLLGCEFDVKLVHFHCSSKKQFERLKIRGHPRDTIHLDLAKFAEYRHTQIKNHLAKLSQISQYCIIDAEHDEDMDANIQRIIQYLESPLRVQLSPNITKNMPIPSAREAMEGTASFRYLLEKAKQQSKYYHQHRLFGVTPDEKVEQPKVSSSLRASL